MSTSDRLLLFLHIGFAIFTLGPLTAATMATPRHIRKRDVVVVRHLHRTTQIYGMATLGIFLFGLLLAEGDLAEVWLSVSMTLFVVALVLLLIVERDQRKAARLLAAAAGEPNAEAAKATEDTEPQPTTRQDKDDIAQVERGRIAALSGVVALLWLVILVLMVWNG